MLEIFICVICGSLGGIIYGGIQYHQVFPYVLIGALIGLVVALIIRFGLDEDLLDLFDSHD